jgi:DNA-binding response OmpR family regulator
MKMPDAQSIRLPRCLLIEDDSLIAVMVSDQLTELGYEVIGPISTLEEARRLAASAKTDAALLNLSLHGQLTKEVGKILAHRKVPFALVTGYTAVPGGLFQSVEVLRKPFSVFELKRTLEALRGNSPTEAFGSRSLC